MRRGTQSLCVPLLFGGEVHRENCVPVNCVPVLFVCHTGTQSQNTLLIKVYHDKASAIPECIASNAMSLGREHVVTLNAEVAMLLHKK